jgi:hypothetical protein
MSINYTINGTTVKDHPFAPLNGDNKTAVLTSVARADARYKIALSAAAEAANSITVTATVTTQDGTAAGSVPVYFTSLAVTADKGDLSTGGTGTLVKAVNPATGANVAWMTAASGVAKVAVANDQVESTIVTAICGDACQTLVLTFA